MGSPRRRARARVPSFAERATCSRSLVQVGASLSWWSTKVTVRPVATSVALTHTAEKRPARRLRRSRAHGTPSTTRRSSGVVLSRPWMRDLPSADAPLPVTKPSSDFEKLQASPSAEAVHARERHVAPHVDERAHAGRGVVRVRGEIAGVHRAHARARVRRRSAARSPDAWAARRARSAGHRPRTRPARRRRIERSRAGCRPGAARTEARPLPTPYPLRSAQRCTKTESPGRNLALREGRGFRPGHSHARGNEPRAHPSLSKRHAKQIRTCSSAQSSRPQRRFERSRQACEPGQRRAGDQ